MRKKIKSYLVFTSLWYRFGVYLAIPAVLAAIGLLIERGLPGGGLIVISVLLPVAEIISDSWLFGDIQTKDSMKLEYLKTSGQGKELIRTALWTDLFRKLLSAIVIMALFSLAMVMGKGEAPEAAGTGGFGSLLYLVLLSWLVSVLGTFVSRYASLVWINLIVSYGAMVLAMLGIFLLRLAEHILLIDLLFAIFGILMSTVAVKAAVERVERSYHDE